MATKTTKKSQIFDYLQKRFGNKTFRYTDITIAALMVNGWIKDPSEYDWRIHRGYYATNITAYSGDYMFNPSKGDTRRLVNCSGTPSRYMIAGKEINIKW